MTNLQINGKRKHLVLIDNRRSPDYQEDDQKAFVVRQIVNSTELVVGGFASKEIVDDICMRENWSIEVN